MKRWYEVSVYSPLTIVVWRLLNGEPPLQVFAVGILSVATMLGAGWSVGRICKLVRS